MYLTSAIVNIKDASIDPPPKGRGILTVCLFTS